MSLRLQEKVRLVQVKELVKCRIKVRSMAHRKAVLLKQVPHNNPPLMEQPLTERPLTEQPPMGILLNNKDPQQIQAQTKLGQIALTLRIHPTVLESELHVAASTTLPILALQESTDH